MNSTPLTPRVAGSTPANVSTPMLKRGVVVGMASPLRDDQALDNNITPRSGPRKARADGLNTTPTATPTPNLQADAPRLYAAAPYNEGSSVGGSSPYLRPAISFSSPGSELGSMRGNKTQPKKDDKFFYASEAKPTAPQPGKIPRPSAQRQPGGYLNARTGIPQAQGNKFGSSSSLSSMAGREKAEAKFFHANGTPDLSEAASPGYASRPGSTISTMSYTSKPRLAAQSTTPRSTSPTKADNPGAYGSLRSPAGRRVPSSSISQNIYAPSQPTSDPTSNMSIREQRRVSGHIKSPSLSRIEHRASIGSNMSSEISVSTDTQRRSSNQLSISTSAGTDYFTSELPSEDVSATSAASSSVLRSPIKAGNSIERMNELAAAARTERKVMDLEITNSSLAAINRTLEREMRKQTAELRRYRRLSRSGRLSILPTAKHENDLSGMDEEEEEEEDSEDEDESENSSCVDESQRSPEAVAESDARHSKRDEKLLQLDLSKHQQLLEDSQKMNQSLKRCLGFTEELIREGKRQLAFKVDKDEVEFGGRVLTAEELEPEEHDGSDETEKLVDTEMASSDVGEGSVIHHDIESVADGLGDDRAFEDASGSKLHA